MSLPVYLSIEFEHPCPCGEIRNEKVYGERRRCILYEVSSLRGDKIHETYGILFGDRGARRRAFKRFERFTIDKKEIIKFSKIWTSESYDFVYYKGVYEGSTYQSVEELFRGRIVFPRVSYEGREFMLAFFDDRKTAKDFLSYIQNERGYKLIGEPEIISAMDHPEVVEKPISFSAFPCILFSDPELTLNRVLSEKERQVLRASYEGGFLSKPMNELELKDMLVSKGLFAAEKVPRSEYRFFWDKYQPIEKKAIEFVLRCSFWANPILRRLIEEQERESKTP